MWTSSAQLFDTFQSGSGKHFDFDMRQNASTENSHSSTFLYWETLAFAFPDIFDINFAIVLSLSLKIRKIVQNNFISIKNFTWSHTKFKLVKILTFQWNPKIFKAFWRNFVKDIMSLFFFLNLICVPVIWWEIKTKMISCCLRG